MTELPAHSLAEVDQLLLNAALRDALEPFLDESVNMVDSHTMTTWKENEYLASMLAWERAPLLPLSSWFEPELKLPDPDDLADQALHDLLLDTLNKLYDNHIVLDYTDHLSDRKLYCLIVRDILSAEEKKLDDTKNIKVVDSKAQKLQSMPTTKANCHKCGHDSAYFWEKQTSSLEEASTQFFRCAKCEHTWRAS